MIKLSQIVPKKIAENIYEVPKSTRNYMKVPVRIFANEKLIRAMEQKMLTQATHVAWLPGIYKHSLVLPDGHMGYGFPIGGVAATDYDEGVISPGGVGYDINCGVRVLRTQLSKEQILPRIQSLVHALFHNIPSEKYNSEDPSWMFCPGIDEVPGDSFLPYVCNALVEVCPGCV